MANHLVVLRPEYRDMFAFLKGQVVARGGLIYCHILKDGDHYLDLEAHSEQNIEEKKILGFHPHSNKDDTPSN